MAAAQKKMNVVQLTFIVMVNMMGSGIIMLPSNMAKVGAISLTSTTRSPVCGCRSSSHWLRSHW